LSGGIGGVFKKVVISATTLHAAIQKKNYQGSVNI